MNFLENNLALITGASSGIGAACARVLAKNKVNLLLLARREDKLEDLKKELSACGVKVEIFVLDVSKKEQVTDFAKKIENYNIDILINSAGLALGLESIQDGVLENWDKMLDVNIKGFLYISRVVIPKMLKQNKGHIINLGSVAGLYSYPNGNVYCATKSAVHSLSKAMNADLFGSAIKVSNIAPGAVETEFSSVRFKGDEKKSAQVYEGYKPLEACDIADLIFYVLNTPKHVNIQDVNIMPTAQRNPYLLAKS